MDASGNIYSGHDEEIPEEDKARLDGYLRAKSEVGDSERLKAELARFKEEYERQQESE